MLRKRVEQPVLTCRHILLYVILITLLFHRGQPLAGGISSWQDSAADVSATSWQITADKITRYTDPARIIAEGNVVLHPQGEKEIGQAVIQADWLSYNKSEGKAVARGNVILKKEKKNLSAEKATIELDTREAVFSEATLFIPKYQLHFTSRHINKETGDIYHFRNGYYTTCPIKEGKNPPWHLNTRKGTLNLNGLGHLRNTVLHIKGFPVFYIPYLPVPLFQERKTGFLLPELSSSSRSGIGISTPYFINLSPSSDLTLYPGYLSRRGVTAGAEFRYFADYESKGYLGFSYLKDRTKDRLSDDYKSDGYIRQEENRYWLWGKMDHDFGNQLIAKLDLDIVSDQDYLQEFENSISRFNDLDKDMLDQTGRGFETPSLPYRSSRFNLGKSWDSAFLGGQLIGIDDNDYPATAADQINTLPHLVFAGSTALERIPAHLTWNTDYVNYRRQKGIGEERLDLHPRLVSNLPLLPELEGIISAGLRGTMYSIHSYGNSAWEYEKRQFRTAWDIKSETATTLTRNFGLSVGSWDLINHSFRPKVAYHYQWINEDGQLPVLDNKDSLADINQLSYSLDNYFRAGGTGPEGKTFENYLGYVKLSQSYDLGEARRDLHDPDDKRRPFSDISLRMNIYPLPRWKLEFESDYSVYGEGVTSYDLFTRYISNRGDMFSIDYRYEKDTVIHEINAEAETKLTNTLILQGDIKQSLDNDETVSSSLNLIYHPQCWALKFSVENTPDDERIAVVLSLEGLGDSLGIGLSGDLANDGGLETSLEGNVLGIKDRKLEN